MNRRDFNLQLQRSAIALAMAPWLTATAQPSEQVRRWRSNPFALGVASGRPRPDSLVLWTRLLIAEEDRASSGPDALRVQVTVFADAALKRRVQKIDVVTDANRGHSVHVPLQNLQPATDYWYRFSQGDALSTVGHARTAPAANADVQQLRMALASCQHYEHGQYIAHQEIAQQSLDFVLFVGDYIYESTNPQYAVRQHSSGEPKTLAQYRERYAQYKRDPHLQAAHAAHPWVLMWDDHEVVNDYANDQDRNYTDPQQFLLRRAAAYQAYFEHQPVLIGPDPQSPQQASMRLYEQFNWGKLADIWTLDCRQYRSPQACRDPVRGGGRMVTQCDELDDPKRSMLGTEQERWLDLGLAASKRTWRLLAQATLIAPTSIPAPVGRATYNDAWDGYGPARQRLLQSVVDHKLNNVVTLGGDVHMNVASNLRLVPNDPQSPIVASEFVTTSITSRGMGDNVLGVIKANNPDLLHARADERGYSLITVTPSSVRCDFRSTAFPAGKEAGLKTQASYVVRSGKAGPTPV
ncbi:alkaline phosphatase D family protein [Limnohabitans sp.]|uniref:alkaline phosphatase D family protein n=1 Tax=Limnohabitans sp. TaxID=1907725 RepID=UPI00286F807B|nr:alkaline phosphatase D family protein [Limnohabitans sp.]